MIDDEVEPVSALRRLVASARREPWLLGALAFIAVLNITALLLGNQQTARIKDLALANREVLAVQVPALRSRIAERDQTIEDQKVVINQAVAAIIAMSDQIEKLGGKPPKVVLQPPEHKKENP